MDIYSFVDCGVCRMALCTLGRKNLTRDSCPSRATLRVVQNGYPAVLSLMLMLVCLSACSNGGGAPVDNAWNDIASTQTMHKVQAGETIYTIAWRYGVSYQDLAAWNHLSSPYYLSLGQSLRITGPAQNNDTAAASAAAPQPVAQPIDSKPTFKPIESTTTTSAATTTAMGQGSWAWPAKGNVLETYGQNGNKGLDIALPEGAPVKAVQDGSVVYAGNNLRGYGQLVIVKQKNDLMTAYAHNSQLLVKVDQHVTAGQTIAKSGSTDASKAMLHFEVRKAGKPVDPLQYLQKN